MFLHDGVYRLATLAAQTGHEAGKVRAFQHAISAMAIFMDREAAEPMKWEAVQASRVEATLHEVNQKLGVPMRANKWDVRRVP